jgi:hypothetical protein
MNPSRLLTLAAMAALSLTGCATSRVVQAPAREAATACEVHRQPMEHQTVPVIHDLGAPVRPAAPTATERATFPHAHQYVDGRGRTGAAKTEKIWVCQECVVAERRWYARPHPLLAVRRSLEADD